MSSSEEPKSLPYPAPRVAWYMVGVLMVIYVFSFVDRQILGLLVAEIKRDLDISDTQMSYLMGLSFAVFYTFFGIPLGRLADSKSRRGLIAIGLVVWSAMTAACGLARQFWHFLLLRMGVGIGEAALSPAAYSLITDSFPKNRLATAISVYSMGIYIGSGMAYLLGGIVTQAVAGQESIAVPLVGDIRPWQVVFLIVGLPGLLITFLLLTFKEPIRRGTSGVVAATQKQLPLSEVVAYMKKNWTTILCHNLGFALLSFSSYGTGAWIAEFFRRTHAFEAAKTGIVYGTLVIIFGTTGIVFGGRVADRLAAKGYKDARVRAGLIASVAWIPTGVFVFVVPGSTLAFVLLAPTIFFASMPFGCAPAAIQEMMPNAMRGQASAIYLFVVNLIGLGLGPSAVAWTTDYLFRNEASLNLSLLVVTTVAHIGSAVLLWIGLKPFRKSLDDLEKWEAANAA